jgi:hypothetical protein
VGFPTRTVATVADLPDGKVRLLFTCAETLPDRWKEYAYKEPEGGRLWFLGKNKNSKLGVRIEPYAPPRLALLPGSRASTRSAPPRRLRPLHATIPHTTGS